MHQATHSSSAWTCTFSFSTVTNYQLAMAWKEGKINKHSQNSSAKTISCSFETKGNIICSLPCHAAQHGFVNVMKWAKGNSCDMNRSQTDGRQNKQTNKKNHFMRGKCGKSWVYDKQFLKLKNMVKLIYGWWSELYWTPEIKYIER